jgi:hypothetical protein
MADVKLRRLFAIFTQLVNCPWLAIAAIVRFDPHIRKSSKDHGHSG